MPQIEIFTKKGFKNAHGEHVLSDIAALGVKKITKVVYSPLYDIDGYISYAEAETIALELLSDKITETYVCYLHCCGVKRYKNVSIIEVWYKKDVTDTVSESTVKAVRDLGIKKDIKVKTGHKYYLYGKLSQVVLNKIATKLLANTLIQEYKIK